MPRPKKEKPNRSDGRYEIKVTIGKRYDGALIRKSFYSDISKADAKRQAEEYKIMHKAAQLSGTFIIDERVGFSEWADRWLETYIKNSDIKDNTYSSTYEIPVRLHLKPFFGDRPVCEILTYDIQRFFNEKSKDTSIDTLRRYRRCLKSLFDSAVENELCFKNPVTTNVRLKSEKPKNEKRFYTKDQRERVLEFAKGHRNGLPIIIMMFTGLSRSELLGLKWDDITPDLVISVRRGVVDQKNRETGKWEVSSSEELKTAFRARQIPIEQWMYDLIKEKPRSIKLGGSIRNKTAVEIVWTEYVFHNARGGIQSPHNFSYYIFKPFMKEMHEHYLSKKIDVPALDPHEMRHTWATLLAMDGIDLYTISKLGGWSDLKMLSKVYGHSEVEALRKSLGYDNKKGKGVVKVSSDDESQKLELVE